MPDTDLFVANPSFHWTDSISCSRQLTFTDGARWYISTAGVKNSLPLLNGISNLRWSSDGEFFFAVRSDGTVIRARVEGMSAISETIDLKHNESSGHDYQVRDLWPLGNDSAVCLVIDKSANSSGAQFRRYGIDANTSQLICSIPTSNDVDVYADAENGRLLAVISPSELGLFDLLGNCLSTFTLDAQPLHTPALSPDGSKCVVSAGDGRQGDSLWHLDLATGCHESIGRATLAAWSSDGSTIAALDADQKLWIMNVASAITQEVLSAVSSMGSNVSLELSVRRSLGFSQDGRYVAFTLCAWEERGPNLVQTLAGYSSFGTRHNWHGTEQAFVLDLSEKQLLALSLSPYEFLWRPRR